MSRTSNSGSGPKLACEISADRVLAGRVSENGGRTLEACASNELSPGSVVPDLIETNLRQPDGVKGQTSLPGARRVGPVRAAAARCGPMMALNRCHSRS